MAFNQLARSPTLQKFNGSCISDLTPPVFAGIASLVNNIDGSLQASWLAATDSHNPISYEIYVQKNSATGLFTLPPKLSRDLTLEIRKDSLGAALIQNDDIYVGVRARDALGNLDNNVATLHLIVANADYSTLILAAKSIAASAYALNAGAVGKASEADNLVGQIENNNINGEMVD